jgi:hypothetical protein
MSSHRPALLARSLEIEARYVAEDPVVGDEWDAEAQSGRGDPAVGVVLALGESVTVRLARCP